MTNTPGVSFRTIWLHPDDPGTVQIIDQRRLPHRYEVVDLQTHADGAIAIRDMLVRGAPLIGATAAWSLYLAALEATRPTAVNLRWGIDRMLAVLTDVTDSDTMIARLRSEAETICDEDVAISRGIGEHGARLLAAIAEHKDGEPHPHPRVGRRDATPKPGLSADGVGTGAKRHFPYRHRGQCRRPPDAARPGRYMHHGHRPHDACRRRRQQDRHLPESAGCA
jgi:hypothetical protein